MWLLTSFGFYSIVQKKDQPVLTIRTRVAADLDALRERYLPDLSAIQSGPGMDYPFFATAGQDQFSAALAKIAADIDYTDFRETLQRCQGEDRLSIILEAWSTLHKLEGQNQTGAASCNTPAFGRQIAYGAVVINCEGKVLLREPFNHRGGHAWTFPKDKPLQQEKPEQTAVRAAEKKAGVRARVIDQIPGVFSGDTTSTGYFLMMFEKENVHDGCSSKSVAWLTREEAETHIKMSTSVMGRARDLEVLTSAFSLYHQRFRQGAMSDAEINEVENRILTCGALRFDGYGYADRTQFDCPAALELFLQSGDLPASPLDQLCLCFALQRRLMKWDSSQPKNSRAWQAFRQLFLTTSSYCIPTEYRNPEYCDRWRSEFLSKLEECTALVQVIHLNTVYQNG